MPKPEEFFNYHYRVIDLDLSNGLDNVKFQYGGNAIHYVSGSVPIYIKLNQNSEDSIPLYPGMKIEVPFSQFFVTADAFDETIKLHVYDPAGMIFGHNAVNVYDILHDQSRWKYSLEGKAFIGYAVYTSAAGYYGGYQLWNPSDSNVLAIVRGVTTNLSTGREFVFAFTTSKLANDSNYFGNKHSNKDNPKCKICYEDQAAFPTNRLYSKTFSGLYSGDNLLNDNIIVSPGYGLLAFLAVTNIWCGVTFSWIEIPI